MVFRQTKEEQEALQITEGMDIFLKIFEVYNMILYVLQQGRD